METDLLFEEEFEAKSALMEDILQERSDARVREAEMQYLSSEHGSRLADYLYDNFGGLGNKARCRAIEEYAMISGGLIEELAGVYRSEDGIRRERSLAALGEKMRGAYFNTVIKNKERLAEAMSINRLHALNKITGHMYFKRDNKGESDGDH